VTLQNWRQVVGGAAKTLAGETVEPEFPVLFTLNTKHRLVADSRGVVNRQTPKLLKLYWLSPWAMLSIEVIRYGSLSRRLKTFL
jgi:hypothetical protein